MKSILIKAGFLTLTVVAMAMLTGAGTNKENLPDAKANFIAAGCNSCHSIQSQGIAKTGKSDARDLSGCGLRHNADWIVKFLNKEVTLDDKKHVKKWKGSAPDLATVATWLAGLKRR